MKQNIMFVFFLCFEKLKHGENGFYSQKKVSFWSFYRIQKNMGSSLSRRKRNVKDVRKLSLVFCGLDGAGKSTLISHLDTDAFVKSSTGENNYLHPTTGLRLHQFEFLELKWKVWDMSGRSQYRNMWKDFYQQASAIVFVVDASRHARLGVVSQEWRNLIEHPSVKARCVPILVLLNKLDHATDNGNHHVRLNQIRNIFSDVSYKGPVHYRTCSGMTGEGLGEGFQWVVTKVKEITKESTILKEKNQEEKSAF